MTSVVIRRSAAADAGELFTLQRAAFVDEAFIYETPEVPPLAGASPRL